MAPNEKQTIEIEKLERDPLLSFNQAVTGDCSDFLGTALISRYYQIAFVLFVRTGAPGETRIPGLLVRSKVVQNSKFCCW